MSKKLLSFVLLMVTIFMMTACIKAKEIHVQGIEVRPNSFKSKYDVDEEVDLSNAYIEATFDNGDKKTIKITEDMLQGFDTTTTGIKELYVKYEGIESKKVNYSVEYGRDISKEIVTQDRLLLSEKSVPNGGQYVVTYEGAFMPKAILFTFTTYTSKESFSVSQNDCEIKTSLDGWEVSFETERANEIRVLLYATKTASMQKGEILTITLLKSDAKNLDVVLDDIEIADGQEKYHLPFARKK